MKKRILAGVLASAAALAAVSFSGCNNDGATGPHTLPVAELTDDDDTLTILAWETNSDMQGLIDYFCEATGTPKEKVVWAKVGAKGEDARDNYGAYLDGSGDADLIFCDADWTALYANNENDYVTPLSSLGLSESDFPNAYPYTIKVGTNEAGQFVGATWQATPGGFVYRADYAEEYLGVKTPDEMQALVKDWDTFEQTAEKLATEHGVALCATEGGLWQIMQCQRSSQWVQDGKLVVDSFATDFIQKAKDYADKGYITKETQWEDPWYNVIREGKALGDFAPTWGVLNNSTSIAANFAGDEKGVLGLCEGPASWYWGGTYMQVTSKCNSKSLAKKWIETFSINEDTMAEYSKKSGDLMNNSKVMEEVAKDTTLTNKLFKDGIHQFGVLYKSADKVNLSVTKYDSVIKGAFNQAVQDYAINGKHATVDDAVAAFKAKVSETYGEIV